LVNLFLVVGHGWSCSSAFTGLVAPIYRIPFKIGFGLASTMTKKDYNPFCRHLSANWSSLAVLNRYRARRNLQLYRFAGSDKLIIELALLVLCLASRLNLTIHGG